MFPYIEWPNIYAQIWLTLIGCTGLLIVTREFNTKQREMFGMEFEDVSSKLIGIEPTNISSNAGQATDKLPHRTYGFRVSNAVLFLIALVLRPRSKNSRAN